MVLYLNRCNFRCPFCHNKELVIGKDILLLAEERVLGLLASRRGFVDGVVITGGEPTIHPGLLELIVSIKKLGFAVKLDTNGYNSEALKSLFTAKAVDFVSMDLKTSWQKYDQATGVKVNVDRLIESYNLIKQSNVEHEFRTTCVPSLVDAKDIQDISRLVGSSGLFTLQQYQPDNTLDIDFANIIPYSHQKLLYFLEMARKNTNPCRLIGLR